MDKHEKNNGLSLMPIREVVKHTGIQAVTLRAWERRYGLIKPQRTSKGHRLYSQEDISRIKTIMKWINRGVTVSQVSQLIECNTAEAIPEHTDVSNGTHSHWQETIQAFIEGITYFDGKKIKRLYHEMHALYPLTLIHEQLLNPLHDLLHERWKSSLETTHVSTAMLGHNFYYSILKQTMHAQLEQQDKQSCPDTVLILQFEEPPSLLPELTALVCHQKQISSYCLHYTKGDFDQNIAAFSVVSEISNAKAIIVTSDVTLSLKSLEKLSKLAQTNTLPVTLIQQAPLNDRSTKCIHKNLTYFTSLQSFEDALGNNTLTWTKNRGSELL